MGNKDIALIGAGVANTALLYDLVERYSAKKFQNKLGKLTVKIFDIRSDFISSGEAYAGSTYDMTFSNTVQRPDEIKEPESRKLWDRYSFWLRDNKERLIQKLSIMAETNESVKRWLDRNEANFRNEAFDDIHFPRPIFGEFMKEIMDECLIRAEEAGIKVDLIQGKVTDIERLGDGSLEVKLATGAKKVELQRGEKNIQFKPTQDYQESISVNDVVLGLGLAPRQRFAHTEGKANYFDTHITKEADPKPRAEIIKERVAELYNSFSPAERRAGRKVKIAAIGTNAAYADLLPLLDDSKLEGKFVLTGISKNAKIPISSKSTRKIEKSEAVHLFEKDGTPKRFDDIKFLFEALHQEIKNGETKGWTRADVFNLYIAYADDACTKETETVKKPHFNEKLFSQLDQMGIATLVGILGITDPNTADSAKRLSAQGALEIINERLQNNDVRADGNGFKIKAGENEGNFDMVINVSSAQNVEAIPLIKSMKDKGLVRTTSGEKSHFEFDDRESNKVGEGIYVAGAMVGGTGIKACLDNAAAIGERLYGELQQQKQDKTREEAARRA